MRKKRYATQIRMPLELAERLKTVAKKERRSFNGQIVFLLDQAVEKDRADKQSGGH
jgi:predicted DNA-binding protein